jgi:hypothetical protein
VHPVAPRSVAQLVRPNIGDVSVFDSEYLEDVAPGSGRGRKKKVGWYLKISFEESGIVRAA